MLSAAPQPRNLPWALRFPRSGNELPELAHVFGSQSSDPPDAVPAKGPVVFAALAQNPSERSVAFAPDPHLDQHLRQVGQPDIAAPEVPEHGIVIGGDLEARVVKTPRLENLAPQIEGRVRRHPSPFQKRLIIGPRAPMPDHLVGVNSRDIVKVAIDPI